MRIEATPLFGGENVVGGFISGVVHRPLGGDVPIQLYDDGSAAHGDTQPGDGIYSAVFNAYRGNGTYTFDLKVEASGARTYAGEDLFANAPPNTKPVPSFERAASVAVVVSGVPNDPTPPVITGVPGPVVIEQATRAGTAFALAQPTAVDDVSGPVPVTSDAPAIFPLGTTTVTFRAADQAGNVATASTSVTVVDTRAPGVTVVPTVTAECTSASGTQVPLPAPQVQDICDAAPVVANNALQSYLRGTTPVTWIATDASGNRGTAVQNVVVVDTTRPSLNAPKPLTITKCTGANIGTATGADTCGTVTISSNAPAKFPLGTTVVTWKAVDPAGNVTTATQVVTAILNDDASCCPTGTRIITGNSFSNQLVGTSGSDCILGRAGDDVIDGRDGDDYISGGLGRDTIFAGNGNDRVYGNDGEDTINAAPGANFVDGGPGDDVCSVTPPQDTVLSCNP